jgi:thioredoxin
MKKILTLLALGSCLCFAGIKKIDAHQYKNVIQGSNLTVVDFFALWCGPCREYIPIVEAVSDKNHDVHFYKINIDGRAEKRLMGDLGVRTIPTLIFYRNGNEVYRSVGRMSKTELMKLVAKYKG